MELGVRDDVEAKALRRAHELYADGKRTEAGAVFRRYSSPAAQVGAAFAAWPVGTLSRLESIAGRNPDDALVLLNLGVARFWSGDEAGAGIAWRSALARDPDSPSAITADWLLHPDTPQGAPVFVPSFPARRPADSPAAQLAALRREAQKRDVRARLLYGVALQRVGRQRSAERAYAAAAAVAPRAVEPQVAMAVARFSRSDPARAFSKLGPLTRKYPREATVRFHLGLLLAWRGQVEEAERQFEQASSIDHTDPLAREAARWLTSLRQAQQAAHTRSSGPEDESEDP
jgi:Flp pilus assembly protein TadD